MPSGLMASEHEAALLLMRQASDLNSMDQQPISCILM